MQLKFKIILWLMISACVGILWLMIAMARAENIPMIFSMVTTPCSDTKELEGVLAKEYKETTIGAGLTTNGDLVRIFMSERTFTILSTKPNGMSCIISAGKNWEVSHDVPGRKT